MLEIKHFDSFVELILSKWFDIESNVELNFLLSKLTTSGKSVSISLFPTGKEIEKESRLDALLLLIEVTSLVLLLWYFFYNNYSGKWRVLAI